MYFVPACTFASSSAMSPTCIAWPVAGMICITPTAPALLTAAWSRRDSW